MWLLMKTAWRNLFRQRRRTLITVSAMAFSLAMAIPFYGLILGVREQVVQAITGMEIGHLQVHDPAYARGRALQSTLRRPDALLKALRATPGVKQASARVHGYGLLSNDRRLNLKIVPLAQGHAALQKGAVRFGRGIDPRTRWRGDVAQACEALVDREAVKTHEVNVGTVFAPATTRGGKRCERVRVVGVLRAPLGAGAAKGVVLVALPQADASHAFPGKTTVPAVVRGAAPVGIAGVLPEHERRITFMKDRMVQGRYLGAKPTGEILVGHRLAKTLKLRLGAPVFVQAASLDMSTGAFYGSFKVVGIYKTGVEGIDRTRVFIHLRDAQKLMALGRQAHEIVIRAGNPHRLAGVKARIAKMLDRGRLQVQTRPAGKRAGVRPLHGAAVVVEPRGADAELLVPDGLKRRLEIVDGLSAVARRVYAKTSVRLARRIPTRVKHATAAVVAARLGAKPPENRCTVYSSSQWAKAKGLTSGQPLMLQGGEEGACPVVTLRVLAGKAGPKDPDHEPETVLAIPAPDSDSDDLLKEVSAGPATLLQPGVAQTLATVGVETALERRVPSFAARLASGRFPDANQDRTAGIVSAMLTEAAARALGAKSGAALLVQARDEDGKAGWRSVRLVGLLKGGAAGAPVLFLPYFEAQQIDAKRLNARAHELVLIPAKDANPKDMATAAGAQLRPLVRTWAEINPGMNDIAKMQDTFMGILAFIIFAIAAMTVMNTMLMAVFERTREFGVLKSLGMRPRQVMGLIFFETLFIAVIAVAIGGGIGTVLDHYLSVEGLDLSGLYGGVEVQGTFIDPRWKAIMSLKGILVPMYLTAIVCLVVSFYPALRAGRLKPVQAMRQRD